MILSPPLLFPVEPVVHLLTYTMSRKVPIDASCLDGSGEVHGCVVRTRAEASSASALAPWGLHGRV